MNIHYLLSESLTDYFTFWHDKITSYQEIKNIPSQTIAISPVYWSPFSKVECWLIA